MINYSYEIIIEHTRYHDFCKAEVRANSDVIMVTDGYLSCENARIAAEHFIAGIKFGRGEE